MKITRVHATWVHVAIPPERQHTSDFGRIASFDSVIVKVETVDLAPLLRGEDPRDVGRLWEVMYNRPRHRRRRGLRPPPRSCLSHRDEAILTG